MKPLPTQPGPGLYNRYEVKRRDGKSTEGHEYFVLRVDKDAKNRQVALHAACEYAIQLEKHGVLQKLSDDVWHRYRKLLDLPEKVIVMLPGYYGIGDTLEEAMRKAIDLHGVPSVEQVWMIAKKATDIRVTGDGTIMSRGCPEEFPEEEVREAFKNEMRDRLQNSLDTIESLARQKEKCDDATEEALEAIQEHIGKDFGLW